MVVSEENPFRFRIRVKPEDIDAMGHVNNVVYVRWVQEVASAHWDTVANETLRRRFGWVVLRHEIDYKNPSYLNDSIIGTTWVGNYHGARFERFVKLVSENDGKVLAQAKTMWCMLDAITGKPARITEEVLAVL